jgi:hypothetical protein
MLDLLKSASVNGTWQLVVIVVGELHNGENSNKRGGGCWPAPPIPVLGEARTMWCPHFPPSPSFPFSLLSLGHSTTE